MKIPSRSPNGDKIHFKALVKNLLAFFFVLITSNHCLAADGGIEWRLDSDLEEYPYSYQIGFELEVTTRTLMTMVEDVFDWEELENWRRSKAEMDPSFVYVADVNSKTQRTDMSLGYLKSPQAFSQLQKDNPELAAQLATGLNLNQTAKLISSDSVESLQKTVQPHPAVNVKTGVLQQIQDSKASFGGANLPSFDADTLRQALESKPSPQGSQSGIGWSSPGKFKPLDFSWGDTQKARESDSVREWRLLSNRWDQLPEDVRIENLRLPLMNARAKAQWIIANIYQIKFSSLDDILKETWFLRGELDMSRDGRALEFRNIKPKRQANTVLAQLELLLKSINQFQLHDNPLSDFRRDTGYHIHISVDPEERPESLQPLLEAYDIYQAFKSMQAGVSPFHGSPMITYSPQLTLRGSVRLIDPHHIELRAHWTNAAKEVSLFLRLMKMSNSDAIAYLFKDFLPNVSLEHMRQFLLNSPEGFENLMTHPFIPTSFSQKEIDDTILKFVRDSFERGPGGLMKNLSLWSRLISPPALEQLKGLIYSYSFEKIGSRAFHFIVNSDFESPRLKEYIYAIEDPIPENYLPSVSSYVSKTRDQKFAKRFVEELLDKEDPSDFLTHAEKLRISLDTPQWLDEKIMGIDMEKLGEANVNLAARYFVNNNLSMGDILSSIKSLVSKNRGCSVTEYVMCLIWHLEEPGNQYAKRLHDRMLKETSAIEYYTEEIAAIYVNYGRKDLLANFIATNLEKNLSYNFFATNSLNRQDVIRHGDVLEPVFQMVMNWLTSSPEVFGGNRNIPSGFKKIVQLMPDLEISVPSWLKDKNFQLDRSFTETEILALREIPFTQEAADQLLDFLVNRPKTHLNDPIEVNLVFELIAKYDVQLTERFVTQLLQMIYSSSRPQQSYHRAQEVLVSQGYHKQALELYRNIYSTASRQNRCGRMLVGE